MASHDNFSHIQSSIEKYTKVLRERAEYFHVPVPSINEGVAPQLSQDSAASTALLSIAESSAELNALVKGPHDVLITPGVCHDFAAGAERCHGDANTQAFQSPLKPSCHRQA